MANNWNPHPIGKVGGKLSDGVNPYDLTTFQSLKVWDCAAEKLPTVGFALPTDATTIIAALGKSHDWDLTAPAGTATIANSTFGWKVGSGATQYDSTVLAPITVDGWTTLFGSGATYTAAGQYSTTAATLLNSGRGIYFAADIRLVDASTAGDAIANVEIMAGLHGTAAYGSGTSTTKGYTVPDDGAYFYYNSGVHADWCAVVNYDSSGTVDDVDRLTGVGPKSLPTTLDEYGDYAKGGMLLEVLLAPDRKPWFYINGVLVYRHPSAVDASTALIPVISVKTLTGAAKYVYVRRIAMGCMT